MKEKLAFINSFSFLDDEEEDIYTESDGTPIREEE
jgi:hypothetical protein